MPPAKVHPMVEAGHPGEEQRQAIRAWMRAVMEQTGWAALEWARRARTSPTNITRFLKNNDASMPSWQTMGKLARVAPLPPPTVENIGNLPDLPPTTVSTGDYIPILALEMRPGMGGAGYQDLTDTSTVLFPRRLIRDQLGARAEDLRYFEVEGPSMEPMLESGDQVLVNITKRNPSQPGIFCLFDGFGTVCKLVERIRNTDPPMVRIISANSLFKPEEIAEADAHIMGRVVWFARQL